MIQNDVKEMDESGISFGGRGNSSFHRKNSFLKMNIESLQDIILCK